MNKPFEKKTPSVFVVCSPFQILCAIAAIRQLEINDYLMLVVLPRGEIRNSQVIEILKKFDIAYKPIVNTNRIINKCYILRAAFPVFNKYKRLFIGDFRNELNYYIGLGVASNAADVVYLDDGNITINQLMNKNNVQMRKLHLNIIKVIGALRSFVFFKNLFTIFDDIPNHNYNITSLQLCNVVDLKENLKEKKDIYVVGTNISRYCDPAGIKEDYFIEILERLFSILKDKYPEDNVIYVAHGRENKYYAEKLCEKFNAEFCRSTSIIEIELLTRQANPKAIYGFTSTALFTLKKIYPEAKVVNLLIEASKDNPYYKNRLICSEYYKKNGIVLVNNHMLEEDYTC